MTWYHGTTAADAKFIISDGIKLNIGLPNKDFSDGKGFYIQDDLKSAIKWPRIRAGSEVSSAVLIYRLKKKDLETMSWPRQRVFDDSNLDAWRSIVQYYR